MCGIAGWFVTESDAWEHPPLERLCAALRHRGPDDRGFLSDGPVGLAHTRLAIIDPAGGQQPLYSDDRRLALVVNGEIYNYVELRKRLETLGYRFSTRSDCEPLLYAYREYGDQFLNHVEGMFAFALYDSGRNRLLLGRDRLGIKPLFVASRKNGVYFASEMKVLFPICSGRPVINPEGLAQYFQSGFTNGRTTVVEGIERVLPGEMLIIDRDGTNRSSYWKPRQAPNPPIDFTTAEESFESLIDVIVRQHVRSDVPFGLFLSGGVDSSILLALLSRHTEEPLHTYSVGFAARSVGDELPTARTVSQAFDSVHTEITVDSTTLLRRLPFSIWAADELMADYANIPTSLLAERAQKDLKVIFSGEGGDEVFAGYGRYRMPRVKRWIHALGAPGTRGFRTRGIFDGVRSDKLFRPELSGKLLRWRAPFLEAWNEVPNSWSTLQHMQYVDLRTWLPNDLLVKVDRMLMSYGVEGRVPFLDHRLVEFGLTLPDKLKVEGRSGKVFLKRWAERILPKQQLWGRKRGFTVPVREWLVGETLDRIERALLASSGVREWCRPDGLRQLIAAHRRSGHYAIPLWLLFHFALWHRLFLEGGGGAPSPDQDPFDLFE
jgi:asparagine synthase (glutamine-hydrolysing)